MAAALASLQMLADPDAPKTVQNFELKLHGWSSGGEIRFGNFSVTYP